MPLVSPIASSAQVEDFFAHHGLVIVGLGLIALLVLLQWVLEAIKESRLPGNKVPTPGIKAYVPFGLANLIDMAINVNNHTELSKQIDLALRHGKTLDLRLLNKNIVATADPKNARAVTSTSFPIFDKGATFNNAFSQMFGRGIFSSDGAQWKLHRAMTRPFFAKDKLGGEAEGTPLFESYADKLLSVFAGPSTDQSTKPVDVQEYFSRYTMDVAGKFLFGADLQCLNQEQEVPFAKSFAKGQTFVLWLIRLGILSPLFLDRKAFQKDMQVVHSLVENIVTQAVARRRLHGKGPPKFNPDFQIEEEAVEKMVENKEQEELLVEDENETLLDHMLDVTEDEELVRDEILNIMLAGRDTTASLLTFATGYLATHPEIYNKAREEVLDLFPPGSRPTIAEVRRLPYLKNIIQETLRLRPPVPGDMREATEDTILPSGNYRVKKGTPIFIWIYTMHQLKEYWGQDAEEFRPERWDDDKETTKRAILAGAYIPFWAGPRICLGLEFAKNEATYTLVRMLQQFDRLDLALDKEGWQTREGQGIPTANVTLLSLGGMWVRFSTAKA